MRDIRFRAWDKINKGFINGFNMIGYSTGQGAPKKKLQRFNTEWSEENIEIMQYTGFKDKNNKNIFESDIVKTTQSGYSLTQREVFFKDGSFVVTADNPDGYCELSFFIRSIDWTVEVIGNKWKGCKI